MSATLPLFAAAGNTPAPARAHAATSPATPASNTAAATLPLVEARAAGLHLAAAMLSKIAKQDETRDDLQPRVYRGRVQIVHQVDGCPVMRDAFAGELTVDHDTTRAANGPGYAAVLAVAAEKLNAATASAVLRAVVELYAEHGQSLGFAPAALKPYEAALHEARQQRQAPARGAVRLGSFEPDNAPPLGVTG